VFRVPPRPVCKEVDYPEAVARCQALNGLGFSRQAWGLRDKLLEANTCRDTRRYPLHEVHPEISFRAIRGEAPRHSKKTWDSQVERRWFLITAGIVLPDDVGEAGRAAPDDILDAAAAAWSADRVARGKARSIPDPPQEHEGSPGFAIWYWRRLGSADGGASQVVIMRYTDKDLGGRLWPAPTTNLLTSKGRIDERWTAPVGTGSLARCRLGRIRLS
jgi:hypothetical protein